jgi:hypothetical protein
VLVDAGIVDAAPTDAVAPDVGVPDSGPPACFTSQGVTASSLKACIIDTDCTFFSHIADCCGSVIQVGINVSNGTTAVACEQAWVPTLPACGCSSGTVTTEDGKSDADGATPEVRCINTKAGSLCETLLP